MNKYLKYGLWSIGGLLALAAAATAYVALSFDPNAYKAQIIQAVKDSKQRTLKLDGDMQLHFFPSISASLGKVSLSEFQSEQEFVSLDSARVSFKLLPLIFHELVVDEVTVSGVKAQFIKYKDGRTNLSDLLGVEQPASAVAVAPTSSPVAASSSVPLQLDIAAVHLDKTDLTYSDETNGARYTVNDLSLKTGRIANGAPSQIEFAAHIQSNKPKLDIKAQLKSTLTLDLEKNQYQVQELDAQANGSALDISDLVLKASGDASVQPSTQELSLKKFALSASGIKDKQGEQRYQFEARLDAPDLNLTQDKFTGDGITLNAKLDAAFGNVVAVLALPAIQGNAQSFKVSSMKLDVDIKQPEQRFKYTITSPVTGSITAQQCNLSDLKLALEASGEKLPGKKISSEMKGSAQADFGRQSIQGNLAGGLLQSKLKVKAAINNFSVPIIRYDLEVDQFDADAYLPKQTAASVSASPVPSNAAVQSAGKADAVAETAIDLSALKTLNVEGSVRFGMLKVANVKIGQLRVDVKARNGQVNVAPISAKVYQGSIDGKAALNVATNSFSLNGKLIGIDTAALLKDVAKLDMLEGKGNITLDLNAQGDTVSALKQALNGKANIEMVDGAVKGIDLNKLVQGLQSLSKDTQVQTLGMDKSAKTLFGEGKASFKLRNGVAHNDDLALKTTVLRVTGKGDVDIGHSDLDYNAKIIFAKTEQGKTATLPLNISGGFDDLKFKADYSALLADVAKQKLDERKDELRAKAREELKKSLKGLIK